MTGHRDRGVKGHGDGWVERSKYGGLRGCKGGGDIFTINICK